MSKRLLFISTMEADPWGGSEELWSQAAVRLALQGRQVFASVKAWRPRPAKWASLEQAGVRILPRAPSAAFRLLQKRFGVRPPNVWRSAFAAARPDFVIVSSGLTIPPPKLAQRVVDHGAPFVNVAQCNDDQWFPPDHDAATYRTYVDRARACFFLSAANRDLFALQIGKRLTNAALVSNPCATSHDETASWTDWSEASTVEFASVARLDTVQKGQHLLFQALAGDVWRSRDWRLTLYGDGPHKAVLERDAEMLGIEEKVRFAGHVADVTGIWRRSHAFLMSSRFEGAPMALTEAMLCGRLAIATPVGLGPELIEDGRTGFVARGCGAGEIAEALERAWAARERWPAIAGAGAARARAAVPRDPVGVFVDRLDALMVDAAP